MGSDTKDQLQSVCPADGKRNTGQPLTTAWTSVSTNTHFFIQFNSSRPTLTAKVTSGKKLSQCRERVFKQKRFQFMLKHVKSFYFRNYMGQAVPSFRPSVEKMALAKLQPSCQWFVTVSPSRSEMDSGRDICGSSNEIRQQTSANTF